MEDERKEPDTSSQLPIWWETGGTRPEPARSAMFKYAQRALIIGLVAILVVALFIGFHGAASLPSPAPQHLPAIPTSVAFSIVDERDDLDCMRAAAWRQDGRLLAVLGNSNDCPLTSYEPGIINIYNNDGMTLIRQLRPDNWIFPRLHLEVPSVPSATPTVTGKANSHYASPLLYYHSILWSPDLQSLGVTFTVITSFQPLQQFEGLLVVNATGTDPEVLFLTEQPAEQYGLLYLVWGLDAGRPVAAESIRTSAQMSADTPLNVAPALSYTWQGGVLAPDPSSRLTSYGGSPPPPVAGSIGNPDGGSTFTPWQSGTVTALNQVEPGQERPVNIYTWLSAFSAWSPNGRYFADAIELAGRFQPEGLPVPSSQELMSQQEASLPVFPVRDQGLDQVLLDMVQHQPGQGISLTASLSWRSDGRVLAVFGIDGINIDFFDCATGRLLGILQNPGSTYATDNGIIGWSPDGNWLLMSSGEILNVQRMHL
jgi:hypothetical protein